MPSPYLAADRSLHGLAHEIVRRRAQNILCRAAAVNQLLADFQQHRHRQRRHPVERLVADVALDSPQEVAEPGDIQQAGGRIRPGRLQQNVARIVLAQHVVDEVRRDGDLAAALDLACSLAGMAPLDQPGDDGIDAETCAS